MFRVKSPDLEDGDRESCEGLLREEQDEAWTQEDELDACDDWATTFLQITILGIFFLFGTLFGIMWHGDLDGQCSQHVSQYCESTRTNSHTRRTLIALSSAGHERGGSHIPPSTIQQPAPERDCL